MKDKELLEKAAKAEGLSHRFSSEWHEVGESQVMREFRGNADWIDWNPIDDDGDALRLKVKAKVPHHLIEHERGLIALLEPNITDECAIERLAITRAAASMCND